MGPTWTTPTKPGRAAAGLNLLTYAGGHEDDKPWFAIGGIESLERLDEVLERGVQRVVMVRAITEAEEPDEAVRAIVQRLE